MTEGERIAMEVEEVVGYVVRSDGDSLADWTAAQIDAAIAAAVAAAVAAERMIWLTVAVRPEEIEVGDAGDSFEADRHGISLPTKTVWRCLLDGRQYDTRAEAVAAAIRVVEEAGKT